MFSVQFKRQVENIMEYDLPAARQMYDEEFIEFRSLLGAFTEEQPAVYEDNSCSPLADKVIYYIGRT